MCSNCNKGIIRIETAGIVKVKRCHCGEATQEQFEHELAIEERINKQIRQIGYGIVNLWQFSGCNRNFRPNCYVDKAGHLHYGDN
jgi:phage FluMu protein Com